MIEEAEAKKRSNSAFNALRSTQTKIIRLARDHYKMETPDYDIDGEDKYYWEALEAIKESQEAVYPLVSWAYDYLIERSLQESSIDFSEGGNCMVVDVENLTDGFNINLFSKKQLRLLLSDLVRPSDKELPKDKIFSLLSDAIRDSIEGIHSDLLFSPIEDKKINQKHFIRVVATLHVFKLVSEGNDIGYAQEIVAKASNFSPDTVRDWGRKIYKPKYDASSDLQNIIIKYAPSLYESSWFEVLQKIDSEEQKKELIKYRQALEFYSTWVKAAPLKQLSRIIRSVDSGDLSITEVYNGVKSK